MKLFVYPSIRNHQDTKTNECLQLPRNLGAPYIQIIKMKKVYLLVHDNGKSYEEHYVEKLCVVNSETVGEEIITKCKKWVAAKYSKIPELVNIDDIDFESKYNSRVNFISKLKPPYRFKSLLDNIEYGTEPILFLIEFPVKTKS